ncbi:MAG TPA: flavodoxin domain-containing protein [Rubrobacter sp.]|nr:flavodoxin domain-containing protein [Rubrobacter sp.]
MKSLIIYESEYGNTEKIARAIGEALGQHGEARVRSVESVATLDTSGLHVLAVGAPTQRHGLPEAVKELLERTPQDQLKGVRALAFDTRYRRARWITGSAAREIGKHLRRMGCKLLAEPESFFVEGSEGPLEPGEEDRARAWAARSLGRTPQAMSS